MFISGNSCVICVGVTDKFFGIKLNIRAISQNGLIDIEGISSRDFYVIKTHHAHLAVIHENDIPLSDRRS